MERRTVGADGPAVGAIAFGAMSFAGFYGEAEDDIGVRTVHAALDAGMTLIDTAEAYGGGRNERMVGRALADRRDRAVLATKSSKGDPDYLRDAAERSLRNLGLDHIDLYYLHRVDPDVPIEESVGAMARLVEDGLVGRIGLSEAGPATIRRAHAVHPIAALQSEYSLLHREPEAELLPLTDELGIAYVAYSPLSRGILAGRFRSEGDLPAGDWRRGVPRFQGENMARNLEIAARVSELAESMGTDAATLSLAWVLARGPRLIPLVGTSRPEAVRRNAAAAELALDPATLAALDRIAPVGAAAGARYPETYMPRLGI